MFNLVNWAFIITHKNIFHKGGLNQNVAKCKMRFNTLPKVEGYWAMGKCHVFDKLKAENSCILNKLQKVLASSYAMLHHSTWSERLACINQNVRKWHPKNSVAMMVILQLGRMDKKIIPHLNFKCI